MSSSSSFIAFKVFYHSRLVPIWNVNVPLATRAIVVRKRTLSPRWLHSAPLNRNCLSQGGHRVSGGFKRGHQRGHDSLQKPMRTTRSRGHAEAGGKRKTGKRCFFFHNISPSSYYVRRLPTQTSTASLFWSFFCCCSDLINQPLIPDERGKVFLTTATVSQSCSRRRLWRRLISILACGNGNRTTNFFFVLAWIHLAWTFKGVCLQL